MCRHSTNYVRISFCKTLRIANSAFVAIRPTAHQMYIIENVCVFTVYICVCVFVRALLIVKLFSEIKCATSLKVTVGTTIKSMGKIIQSREVKQNFIWIITCRRFAACKRSLNGVEVVISAKLPDNILAHSSTFRR